MNEESWLRILRAHKLDLETLRGSLQLTAKGPDFWAIGLNVRWGLAALIALLPLALLLGSGPEIVMLVAMGTTALWMPMMMIGAMGAVDYEAYLAPPYLKMRRSLRISPTVEVDGRSLGEDAPVGVLRSVTSVSGKYPTEYNHVALVLRSTIVRVKTLKYTAGAQEADQLAWALQNLLHLPKVQETPLPEPHYRGPLMSLLAVVEIPLLTGAPVGIMFLRLPLAAMLPTGLLWVAIHVWFCSLLRKASREHIAGHARSIIALTPARKKEVY